MREKFSYYNRRNNMEGLYVWVGSLLKNIGFTDYQADQFLNAVTRIGQRLYKKFSI